MEASELSEGDDTQEEDVLTPAELIARLEEVRSRESRGCVPNRTERGLRIAYHRRFP